MIDCEHDLAITKQAEALNISRGSVYYLPRSVPEADLAIMRRLDRLHLELPFAGSRMLRGLLAAEGCKIGRRHVKTLMRRMGIEALYRRPRTTKLHPIKPTSRRCPSAWQPNPGRRSTYRRGKSVQTTGTASFAFGVFLHVLGRLALRRLRE
jgi:putative transposase